MSAAREVINGETCELVTDFASLRAGNVVYDRACGVCGRAACRETLTQRVKAVHRGQDVMVWEYGPSCGTPRRDTVRAVAPHHVEAGRIWLVIDDHTGGLRERAVSA